MTRERTSRGSSEDLERLLRRLGEEPAAPTRSPEQEQEREALFAERIDAELARLVLERRAAHRRYAFLAAAALVLVFAGLALHRSTPRPLSIQHEPLQSFSARAARTGPSSPIAPPAPQPTAAARTPRRVGAPRAAVSAEPARSAAAVEVPSSEPPEGVDSTLAQENQLFRKAAEAARGGDHERALSLFEQLQWEHPSSPLAQTALVRRFRLLAQTGRTSDAQGEAARYLEKYPSGFAVNEARALVGGSPAPGSSASEEKPH